LLDDWAVGFLADNGVTIVDLLASAAALQILLDVGGAGWADEARAVVIEAPGDLLAGGAASVDDLLVTGWAEVNHGAFDEGAVYILLADIAAVFLHNDLVIGTLRGLHSAVHLGAVGNGNAGRAAISGELDQLVARDAVDGGTEGSQARVEASWAAVTLFDDRVTLFRGAVDRGAGLGDGLGSGANGGRVAGTDRALVLIILVAVRAVDIADDALAGPGRALVLLQLATVGCLNASACVACKAAVPALDVGLRRERTAVVLIASVADLSSIGHVQVVSIASATVDGNTLGIGIAIRGTGSIARILIAADR